MSELMDSLDADMQRAVENVREAASRIWARPLHRYYTDHSVTHSERIIALLDGLTAGMMRTNKRLSNLETYVLLTATYLHDIGMQNQRFAGGDLDEIRAQHHEQTAEMIYKVFEDRDQAFAIPLLGDPTLIDAVALVAKGHRQTVNLHGAEYDELTFRGAKVRLRLLAALLRFGDELDIDCSRVDMEAMKLMKLPPESQLHWWKCYYVNGVYIDEQEFIQIEYRFPKGETWDYKKLISPLVEGEVRASLASLEEIFRVDAIKVALGPSRARGIHLVKSLPPKVEALARKKMMPDLPIQPEFWNNFAVVMSFGKVVHKAFQALDMTYGSKLLERAENIARHPTDESPLSEFAATWQDFSQYYQGFTEKDLFEPPAKMEKWIKEVDDSLLYLRDSVTSIGIDIETSAQAINASSGFYQEVKTLLAEYPELVKDIGDVISSLRVGAGPQDATYPTQLVTKTRELVQMTRTLALDADSLIQNLVDIIVPHRIGD